MVNNTADADRREHSRLSSFLRNAETKIRDNALGIGISVAIATSIAPSLRAQEPVFQDYTHTSKIQNNVATDVLKQKYDIQQVLFIADKDYRSNHIWAYVTPPETADSVAMLLNARTKYGQWCQIGIGKGASSKSLGNSKYGIYYYEYDGKDNLVYTREVMIGKLKPKATYKLDLSIGSNNEVIGTALNKNGDVLYRGSLPSIDDSGNGSNYFIATLSKQITGLMTEKLEENEYEPEKSAVYRFYPNPTDAGLIGRLPRCIIGVDIRSTEFVGEKDKNITYAVTTEYYNNILRLGPYYQWVSPNVSDNSYTFTTLSRTGLAGE